MKLEKMIKGDMFYYVAVALMIINVLGYVSVGSVECVIVFAITTYLSNMYTKNNALDILIGLFVSNIVFGCGRVTEGMESGAEKMKHGAAKAATEARKDGDKDKEEKAKKVQKLAEECENCDKEKQD